MFNEDNLIPLSALQHYAFCPRQCALIHLEREWTENRLTAEGRLMHNRVHDNQTTQRNGIVTCRGLRIRSLELGLVGQADVVEFYPADEAAGVRLAGRRGFWKPVPVEYKRGRPKKNDCDLIQLCAQAMCLQEMMNTDVQWGQLFYGKQRRRREITFDESLRKRSTETAFQVRQMLVSGVTPPANPGPKCKQCSFREICMPTAPAGNGYITREVQRILLGGDESEAA